MMTYEKHEMEIELFSENDVFVIATGSTNTGQELNQGDPF